MECSFFSRGILFGLSQLLFLYIVVKTVFAGKKATPQVWDGADGLEWTVDSPAPYHTFDVHQKLNEWRSFKE